jgi:hypothetical protein
MFFLANIFIMLNAAFAALNFHHYFRSGGHASSLVAGVICSTGVVILLLGLN